jgi:hypothetical protein
MLGEREKSNADRVKAKQLTRERQGTKAPAKLEMPKPVGEFDAQFGVAKEFEDLESTLPKGLPGGEPTAEFKPFGKDPTSDADRKRDAAD